jgi:hypothetical protein
MGSGINGFCSLHDGEGSLQQILERMLASQEKTNAEMKAGQAEMEARADVRVENALHAAR